jgi:hypothetical protein
LATAENYSDKVMLMSEGKVTAAHRVLDEGAWRCSLYVFPRWENFFGTVYDAEISVSLDDTGDDPATEHSFTLSNGRVFHNGVSPK